jgi:hypothetical protein
MKAIKMRIQKFSRPGVILVATVVAIITSIVVANATQTITTPNAVFISYNLAAHTGSATITPATNRSVLVMGCCTTVAGVGQVSLLHLPNVGMEWVGLESQPGSVITQGIAASGHILFIDEVHKVDIQITSSDTIRIYNDNVGAMAGNVTLIW